MSFALKSFAAIKIKSFEINGNAADAMVAGNTNGLADRGHPLLNLNQDVENC